MEKIRWAICDDTEYICFSYRMELKDYPEFEFVGAVHSASECCTFMAENDVDILLLDVQMETESSGIDRLPQIKEANPSAKIIILTNFKDENYIFGAFANGADDFFLKNYPTSDLVKTMKAVYENNSTLRPEIAKILAGKTKSVEESHKSLLYTLQIMTLLSTSEFDVLKAVCAGYSYREIAERRYVNVNTIKSQVSCILKKFDSHDMKKLSKHLNSLKVFDLFHQ